MKLNPSGQLAYWTGIAQTDGSLQTYTDKNGRTTVRIQFGIKECSLPMLIKFQKISEKILNRKSKIFRLSREREWEFHIGVKKLLEVFQNLDIKFDSCLSPPEWCENNIGFFGSYLAGIIDGDGSIRIKRKKYPQCMIKITSGKSQDELAKIIWKTLNCATSIRSYEKDILFKGKKYHGRWFELEFLVSIKNFVFLKKYVVPYITIERKRKILNNYIKNRFSKGL